MIHYLMNLLSRLIEAIKRGILRIFPLPLRPFLYALAILTLLTVYGCATPRHTTQLVHGIQRDTVYLSNVQYDSIYIYKELDKDYRKGIPNPSSLTPHPSPDTIYIKDISVEYKYRYLHDTVRVVQKDSIPYEVTIVETKEITRPLTWYDHLTRLTFWFVFGYLLSIIFFKLKSINYKP